MGEKSPRGSPASAQHQTLVQSLHEANRYAIAYHEIPTGLSVHFTPLSARAVDYLRALAEAPRFLLDEIAEGALETLTPFAWAEAIQLEGTDVVRRLYLSNGAEISEAEVPVIEAGFVGLKAQLHYLGSPEEQDRDIVSHFDVLSVILRSRVAGICHQLSKGDQPVLTEREQSLIKLAAMGKTSEDIAIILEIDKRHVDYAFTTAANKLGTHTRIQTVIAAFKGNLIS